MKRMNKRQSRRCCSETNDISSNLNELNITFDENCQDNQDGDSDCEDGDYNVQSMQEIGRTRLEIDDVCYINGLYIFNA